LSRSTAHFEAAAAALAAMASGGPATPREALGKLLSAHQSRVDARQRSWAAEEGDFRRMVASLAGADAWPRFAGLLGRQVALGDMSGGGGRLAARYDSAQTVDDNRNHWMMADALAADAADSPAVRSILRNRSRYEVANNCYAAGVGLTIANDCIGTGPRLNIDSDSGSISQADADDVEAKFTSWCEAVNLPELLRTMRHARRQDGEAFALLVSNPRLEDPVKLGLRLVEAECVTSASAMPSDRNADGIHLDEHGNVESYEVLRSHPGGLDPARALQFDLWPAALVLHWFRPRRPQQHRGIPEMLPALPLYATLRRYSQATLDAAETAADMAVLLQTQAGAEFANKPVEADPFSTIPFSRRMYIALPQGYEAKQFDPKQPTQVYSDFKREIAGEIGRCENVARNVVLLDSSESNFASGQLDYRITYRQHDIDRDSARLILLDRIFRAWLDEALLIGGYLPAAMRAARLVLPPHSWHWDSNELGDPLKLAKAKAEQLRCGLTSLPELYAARGQDWAKALRLAARGYGISDVELLALIVKTIFAAPGAAASAADEEDQEPASPPASKAGRVRKGAEA
jgi:capsid protein